MAEARGVRRETRATGVVVGWAVAAGCAAVVGLTGALAAAAEPTPQPPNAPVPTRARPLPTDVTPDEGALPTTPAPRPTTPVTKPPVKPVLKPPALPAVQASTLRPGMRSQAVQTLQVRLLRQGFWLSKADGSYAATTSQAVMAFQKAAGLPRDGVAGPKTLAALRKPIVIRPRSTTGHVLEIDKRRQLLLVVDHGKVTRIVNTSTGSGQPYTTASGGRAVSVTPQGRFRIGRQITGWHRAPLGMLYSPKFFTGGYAIHGSLSIPGYPASHGCARVSVAAMDYLWRMKLAQIGTPVWVY
ncbi:MAG: murein L,D-transpeptidase [Austwickia sp.]|nr:murein L,D-transpeptidase [Austwickia sp.]MBK8436662.1 murein L,D-transpeptidase [Austwickia sp.]MBK9100292.1 murein L,D-transpeptidase [Austwickia sp.]